MNPLYDSAQLEKVSPRSRRQPPVGHSPEDEFQENSEPLAAFPKEFNKNYLRSLDRRYLFILFLVLTLEPLLIFYLLQTHPPNMDDAYIARMQSKYADLFLSDFKMETLASDKPENELLLRGAEETGSAETAAAEKGPGAGTPEARGVTREESRAERSASRELREHARRQLSEEVGRSAILNILTSGRNLISAQPVQEILAYSEQHAQDLDAVLSQVQSVRVPRPGEDYYGAPIGSSLSGRNVADEVVLARRDARGLRFTSSGATGADVVTVMAKTVDKSIGSNQQYEVTDDDAPLAGLRSRRQNGKGSRNRDQLREIVMSHSGAVQDCYRRFLKHDASLKGKVTVRFTIAPSGHVIHAEVVASTMDVPGLYDCMLDRIMRWNDFGAVDPAIGDVTIRQTYVFGY